MYSINSDRKDPDKSQVKQGVLRESQYYNETLIMWVTESQSSLSNLSKRKINRSPMVRAPPTEKEF